MAIYENILHTIGDTPIVRLNKLAPKDVSVYVKVESFNPGGSVKDRLAISIILDAERKGLLKPNDTIVECTSGNVGMRPLQNITFLSNIHLNQEFGLFWQSIPSNLKFFCVFYVWLVHFSDFAYTTPTYFLTKLSLNRFNIKFGGSFEVIANPFQEVLSMRFL